MNVIAAAKIAFAAFRVARRDDYDYASPCRGMARAWAEENQKHREHLEAVTAERDAALAEVDRLTRLPSPFRWVSR